MDSLSITASVIAVIQLTGKIIGYLDDIKHAPRDRELLVLEASSLLNLFRSLRYRLEDQDNDLDASWYTAISSLALSNGPLDQFRTALEQLAARLNPAQDRAQRIGQALVWKFRKDEIASVLERIERMKSVISIALTMDHFKLSRALQTQFHNTTMIVTNIKTDTTAVLSAAAAEERRVVLDWISPTDYSRELEGIYGAHQPGTGDWFLTHDRFEDWVDNAGGVLYCPGHPGTGKTVMSAHAIKHVSKRMNPDLDADIYFFCNYQRQSEQGILHMLSVILRQLAASRSCLPETVRLLYRDAVSRRTPINLQQLATCIESVIGEFRHVYFIIDALDECSVATRHDLAAVLRALRALGNVQILATSRHSPEIKMAFSGDASLEIRAFDEDIRAFVKQSIPKLTRCVRTNLVLQSEIVATVSRVAEGMFMLARLHVETLRDQCRTIKDVRVFLDRLVPGTDNAAYEKAYESAIKRIQDQGERDCTIALRALAWITHARRPLSPTELQHALAVEDGATEIDPDNFLDIEELLSSCAGLAALDDQGTSLRLAHYTTHQYLLKHLSRLLPNAESMLATACMTFLRFERTVEDATRKMHDRRPSNSGSGHNEESTRFHELTFTGTHIFEPSLLLSYASLYWGLHARECVKLADQCGMDKLTQEFLAFANSDHAIAAASTALAYYSDASGAFTTGSALHLAAYFGCNYLVRLLLNQRFGPNRGNSWGNTPLLVACHHGHQETAATILSFDISVNPEHRNHLDQTPLFIAVKTQHLGIATMLCEMKVDVNASDLWSRTPLIVAARLGNLDLVRLLLRHHAAVNIVGRDGKGAIFYALLRQDLGILRSLLDHGADVTKVAAFDRSIVMKAGYRNLEESIRLFQPLRVILLCSERLHPDLYSIYSSGGIELLKEFFLCGTGSPVNRLRMYTLQGAETLGPACLTDMPRSTLQHMLTHPANTDIWSFGSVLLEIATWIFCPSAVPDRGIILRCLPAPTEMPEPDTETQTPPARKSACTNRSTPTSPNV